MNHSGAESSSSSVTSSSPSPPPPTSSSTPPRSVANVSNKLSIKFQLKDFKFRAVLGKMYENIKMFLFNLFTFTSQQSTLQGILVTDENIFLMKCIHYYRLPIHSPEHLDCSGTSGRKYGSAGE